jgi:3-deoxy-D-manno-octulosonate 8-phosphate phosphatase (KDO 8-P phosphatase)
MLDLQNIKGFFFDIDGVLTDGFIYSFSSEEVKRTSIKDGYALQLAVKKGYKIGIISGGKSENIKKRLEYLGIQFIYLGVSDKLLVYEQLLKEWDLSSEQVVYVGDDMPDYWVMKKSGLAVAPADAAKDILAIADYVTQAKGGEGVAREIIELVLKAQNQWYEDNYIW